MLFFKKTRKWDISLLVIESEGTKIYKVTRRVPKMFVSQTKVFKTKKSALKQFNEWLK